MRFQLPRHHWHIHAAGIVTLLLLTAVAFWLGFRPLAAQRADHADQQTHLQEARQAVDHLAELDERVRVQLQQLEQAIADSELDLQPVTFLNRRVAAVAMLAEREGLDLAEVQPSAAIAAARSSIVPIQLVGTADFHDSARFLKALSAAFPDITVVAMDLRAQPQQQRRIVAFRLTLHWHATPPAPPAVGLGEARS